MRHVVDDLDPADLAARTVLRGQLVARRVQLGWPQRKTAELGWFDPSALRRLERVGLDRGYAGTGIRWARALGLRLVLKPCGFPPPPAGGVDDLLAAVAAGMSPGRGAQWQVAAVRDELVRIRVVCQVLQTDLARRFGVSSAAVSLIEQTGSSLVVLQRHARGIGLCAGLPRAHLRVHLEDPDKVV